MNFPSQFIAAAREATTLDRHIPAPFLRKSFTVTGAVSETELLICGLGFYELFINGKKITKGPLAPYVSNPDHLLYYDKYDISAYLTEGENVIGILLGNGFQSNCGGVVWEFHKTPWLSGPKAALSLDITYKNGEPFRLESDESFLTHPSPITFDDYRLGEYYDANLALDGWAEGGFDDSSWTPAISVERPRGEAVLCTVDPIVTARVLTPVKITPQDNGYVYDFGENCAGLCTLHIKGNKGQVVTMEHGENYVDGKLNLDNIRILFDETQFYREYAQKTRYTCIGNGEIETYTPSFTYFGFRYVLVTGITKEQAAETLLTYNVMNSKLAAVGDFSCSDEMANTLQKITRTSDLANFYYFPTDCPHREKNGWTGDAAISAEHMLFNLNVEQYYKEWLRNIRKSQHENGMLPGIVPTGGWGYHWGNGPAWDCVLTYLPYYTHMYRGDRGILEENASSILRYLDYLSQNIREDGLISLGLGDWCPVGRGCDQYKSPLELTDSIISMDIALKAASIFTELALPLQATFAAELGNKLKAAIRRELFDFTTMTAAGNCQTSQSMFLYYGLLNEEEEKAAFRRLREIIKADNDKIDVGILGARVLFHVLTRFGEDDLAYEMITTPEYPSYGNWVARGATSLWEDFNEVNTNSLNHHFFGDISHWFIRTIAGIDLRSADTINIAPRFIKKLTNAEAWHTCPAGKIESSWERQGTGLLLRVKLPKGIAGHINLPQGFAFKDGGTTKPAASGEYTITAI